MFCGSTSGNYTSLSFPVIGNSHQGNLQPPISRSGNWLLNVVEENPDVANGLRASSSSAAVLVRVAGSRQGSVSFVPLNIFAIYDNVTTTYRYHFHLLRIHYVAGITLSGHLILGCFLFFLNNLLGMFYNFRMRKQTQRGHVTSPGLLVWDVVESGF